MRIVVVISLLLSLPSFAQTHATVWFRGTLMIPFGNKIEADLELQHRRQNGFENRCPLDQNLLFSFRNWIHYRITKQLTLSASPLAVFYNYVLIDNQTDELAPPRSEVRFSFAGEVKTNPDKSLVFYGKSAFEARRFLQTGSTQFRWRNRIGILYNCTEKLKTGAFIEGMVNVQELPSPFSPEQIRIGVQLNYSFTRDLKGELGYLKIFRYPSSAGLSGSEHNLVLNITYRLKQKRRLHRSAFSYVN